jgi:predicted MarR family transcription regulator
MVEKEIMASFLPKGRAAKVVVGTTFAAIGAVVYSHYAQVRDRQVMRAGVERDRERLRIKRQERKLQEKQQKGPEN